MGDAWVMSMDFLSNLTDRRLLLLSIHYAKALMQKGLQWPSRKAEALSLYGFKI